MSLTDLLHAALADAPAAGRPVGIDVRQELEPPFGQIVMPPSYEGNLEIHPRHLDGEIREVIELDSVGSSANRIEEGLLEEYRAGNYPLPVSRTTIAVNGEPPVTITTLEAPHRIFDAWIRLSAEPGSDAPFETTEHGRELSLAQPGALDPILETSAHDLLFGVWDSHRAGPSGQVRIARSFTSTVLGLDPKKVCTVAARTDPLNLGEAKEEKAPKGKRLSDQGLSSIPPQRRRAGVSVSGALFVGFLSFAALRRLRFTRYDNADARVLLAGLCLHGLLLRESAGWHLRSECDLVPRTNMNLSIIRPGKAVPESIELTVDDTRALLDEAAAAVATEDRSLNLEGGPQLTALVQRSFAAERAAVAR